MSEVPDLHVVVTELITAQMKWKHIGRALHLEEFDISAIDSINKDPLDALTAMISAVLRMQLLTWEVLIDVLREPSVSHDELANQLATKYGEFLKHMHAN